MTGISWADETWNPVVGCTPVSPGCGHCYAARAAVRLERCGLPQYEGLARLDGFRRPKWEGAVRCLPEALRAPYRWTRRRHVFLGSMSDVFHEQVPDAFLDRIWNVMEDAVGHVYLVLTKRAERMADYIRGRRARLPGSPRLHIALGASIEAPAQLDRLDHLYRLGPGAGPIWLSLEPLLEPLAKPLRVRSLAWRGKVAGFADWLVVGGETGPGARPMRQEWAEALRDLCWEGGVPLHFKQWGRHRPGRILCGRAWDERFPVLFDYGGSGPCRTCGRAAAAAHGRCRACWGRLRRTLEAA